MMRIKIRQDEIYGGLESEASVVELVDLADRLEAIGLEITEIDITVQRRGADVQTSESGRD